MAFASALNTPKGLHCPPSSRHEGALLGRPAPTNLVLPRHFPTRFSSTLAFARRKNHRREVTSSQPTTKKVKKSLAKKKEVKEGKGDAIEALFQLLEEDLKHDDAFFEDDGDDDISEEDLARLEQELAAVFGIDDDEEEDDEDDEEDDDDVIEIDAQEVEEEEEEEEEDDDDDDDDDDDEDEVETPVKLKTWQLRRLAYALKVGKRKTSIKNLAAELCLDRAVVLELLREPPPSLLMMSAALPDEPSPKKSVPETKPVEIVVETTVEETVVETTADAAEVETAVKVPIHVMQQRFSAQKRLKKVQIETLERIFRRTKRPTNAVISSIVHVTNLPRKRIVKWFEDKRAEEGVPDSRLPYQRSVPNAV